MRCLTIIYSMGRCIFPKDTLSIQDHQSLTPSPLYLYIVKIGNFPEILMSSLRYWGGGGKISVQTLRENTVIEINLPESKVREAM